MNVYIPRRLVILQLSEERGRSPEHPLTKGLISQWAADLGFEPGQRGGGVGKSGECAALGMATAGAGKVIRCSDGDRCQSSS